MNEGISEMKSLYLIKNRRKIMCLINVGKITINTETIKGVEIEKLFSPYDRGKSRIIAPHPIHDDDVFEIFSGPHAQVEDLHKKIRMAWFIKTPLYIPEPRALTEEERVEAFSEVYQNSDTLIFEGWNWLIYKTAKDILVAKKIVSAGSKREKRVYTGIDNSTERLVKLRKELSEIIEEEVYLDNIIRRLDGDITHTVRGK